MTTTVTKSIGSAGGRDYSTISAFFAAIPSDLVAVDEAWVGELYNDSEFTISSTITCSKTTSVACYIALRPAAGQGFAHHANKLTNPLRYDQSVGVGVDITVNFAYYLDCAATNDIHISGIQWKAISVGYPEAIRISGQRSSFHGNICVYEYSPTCVVSDNSGKIYNNLIIYNNAGPSTAIYNGLGGSSSNFNTIVTLGTASDYAITGFGTSNASNNLVINFNSGSVTCTPTYIATTAATQSGTGSITNIVAADTLQNVASKTTIDGRIKAGAAVINAGNPVSGITTDILGQTRSVTTPTIGAFEYVSAPAGCTTAVNATTANAVGSIASKSTTKTAVNATTANALGSILSSSGLTNTITTPPLKNNTGTLLTGQTGITVNVYHLTTGALVVQKTGQTSHGTTGVVVVTDALITPATQYRVVVILSSGDAGLDKITAT